MSTTKDATKFLSFTADGKRYPLIPQSDITMPDPVEHGISANSGSLTNGDNSEEGKYRLSLMVGVGSDVYDILQSWEERDDHGLNKDIFFYTTFNKMSINGEYSNGVAKGVRMHFKVIAVQPIKPVQSIYQKDSSGFEESVASINLDVVLMEKVDIVY